MNLWTAFAMLGILCAVMCGVAVGIETESPVYVVAVIAGLFSIMIFLLCIAKEIQDLRKVFTKKKRNKKPKNTEL